MSKRREPDTNGGALAQCSEELRAPTWLVTVVAVVVHAGLFAGALLLSTSNRTHAAKPQAPLLEVELAPPPPPAPAEEPPPAPPPVEQPEPVKLKVAKVAPEPTPVEPPPEPPAEPPKAAEPPPEAAQAAQAVTALDNAPTAASDTIVTGDGAAYAGGTTQRGGTATHAVSAANARAGGVPNGTGDTPVDRSQKPRLAGGTDWSCPFPPEAEEDGIDRAVVGLEVEIGVDGSVRGVSVHNDPGSGFGREARACALRKRWLPALDRSGQPVQQKHKLNVTFTQR